MTECGCCYVNPDLLAPQHWDFPRGLTEDFICRSRSSVCLDHMWNMAHLQCADEASILFLLCLSSLDVREGVHSAGTPENTIKDPALNGPKPQGLRLHMDLILAARRLINDNDIIHKCEILWFPRLCESRPLTSVHEQWAAEDMNLLGENSHTSTGNRHHLLNACPFHARYDPRYSHIWCPFNPYKMQWGRWGHDYFTNIGIF